jgi:FAD/FMN-containing dehydrogenase
MATTMPGPGAALRQEALTTLRAALKGPVFLPGDDDYETSRTLWNAMIDRRPALVARPLGTDDVVACVRFARDHDLGLRIKGGGHNIAGLASADGAFMLDMSLMRGVWVDPRRRIARAQPGCLLRDVDRETQLHGLAAVLGFVSATGIAGLTLGGGFGYLTRRWGWTTDTVVAMDVVTADGRLVRASADEHPDLFWGLRGGGGRFGVVTGFEYALHPVGPEIVGGPVVWPADEVHGVLAMYRSLAEEAPRELTLALAMRPAPPAPWLPEAVHGQPIVMMIACYSGDDLAAGERLVAPIKSFGRPVGDLLVRRPYTQLQSLLDATQPHGRRYYWKSEYLASLEPELRRGVAEHAAAIVSPYSTIIVFQIAGALNEIPTDHSPVGNRDARYVLNLTASWEHAQDDAPNVSWARAAWGDLKRFSTGGTYLNFLTADEGPERDEAALGPARARLAELAQRWDPDHVFSTTRSGVLG